MNPNQNQTNAPHAAPGTPQPGQVQPVPPPPQPPQPNNPPQQQPQQGQPPIQPNPKKKDKKSQSTQNALMLAEIRDGIVIMNDGSFRSVVMAKSINFDLMSPKERDAVEFAFASFLNSLYFPVQIYIKSNRVDIRPYLEKLDKQRREMDNMLLSLLMEDYINYIGQLSEETNIMDKQFYVIVPYYPAITTQAAIEGGKKIFGKLFDAFNQNQNKQTITINEATLEEGKTELRNRVQAVANGLAQVGVQTVALDTKELSELFYNAYNPDTATRQQLIDISELSTPVVQKGAGQASDPNLDAEN